MSACHGISEAAQGHASIEAAPCYARINRGRQNGSDATEETR